MRAATYRATGGRRQQYAIVHVNPAFERITGYSATEAIGRNCRFLQGTDTEQAELAVLEGYRPAQASDSEIAAAVAQAISASGAAGPADMGKVMGELKSKLAGRADMAAVSARVREALAAAKG